MMSAWNWMADAVLVLLLAGTLAMTGRLDRAAFKALFSNLGAATVASADAPPQRSQAEEHERQLTQREVTAAVAEQRQVERGAELVALQARLEALQSGLKDRDEANWSGLVKMYEGMRPREAAAIFNALDKPVLLEIVDRMQPTKASPVLAAMDAEKARQVTAELAARRTRSTTATN